MTRLSESYYRATAHHAEPFPELCGRREVEVCIVGGGFAGLNAALGLIERQVRDIVLLESHRIGHGASGRNGGFVFAGYSRGEAALLRELGPKRAVAAYRGTRDAVELIRRRCDTYAISCDRRDSGVLWANWFRDPAILRARQRLLADYFDTDWTWVDQAGLRQSLLTKRYADGLLEPDAFHFHPLNYAVGLAQAIRASGAGVHESSPAIALEPTASGWRVRTPSGEVLARQVVLACGGYLAGLRRRVDASVLPIATYVMVTEPLGTRLAEVMRSDAAVYDSRFAFDYYRPLPDTRLLWGGRISILERSPQQIQRLLYRDMLAVFPQLDGIRIEHAWSGLMSYARHQMPQITRLEPGLWLGQAFGGHGVAPTTYAGELLASAIAEGDARWLELQRYGVVSAFKPAGFGAAQLSYWWYQAQDAWHGRRDRPDPE
jgi:gamma-glutamylputrescine oxidase